MMSAPAFLFRVMVRPKLSNRIRLGPEDQIARAFADNLRLWTLERKLSCVWFHPANELSGGDGARSQIRNAIAQALGMVPGASDFAFLSRTGAYALECKAKTGRMSDHQKDFRDWCALEGVPYEVFRSADEGAAHLRNWGLLHDGTDRL